MLLYKSDYEVPGVRLLFGGYSWDKKQFCLWHIFFDKSIKRFTSARVTTWKGLQVNRVISFIGDYGTEYRTRLINTIRTKKKFLQGHFDMEPFEVLRDILRENTFTEIGGSPQLLKVYEHMNRSPIAIKWNVDDKEIKMEQISDSVIFMATKEKKPGT